MKPETILPEPLATNIAEQFGTPTYVYDMKSLKENAEKALKFPHVYGLTVRYAMKASSNAALLHFFHGEGIHIDASSGYEVKRALAAGIPGDRISLSTQEFPEDFEELLKSGIHFNACSLNQLERYGKIAKKSSLGLRFNPGVGSGGNQHTNVGGPSSSFGIWHELLPEVKALVERYDLTVERIHTHIGSGSDPAVWQKVANLSLGMVREFPDVKTLNLGGGFKVARMEDEASTDLQNIGIPVKERFEAFARETGRELHLEIEPGTFLLANACVLVTTVQDQVATGENGYHFLKLNSGMTELLRPSLYGSQHPITVFSSVENAEVIPTVVVGHCCESGDLLTPAADRPAELKPRDLPQCHTGDLLLIGGVGAYCSSMTTKNYNSFPEAAEVLVDLSGKAHLIRKRQQVEQIWQNEVSPSF